MLAGVLDDERGAARHHVLAERVRERRLPFARHGLGKAHAALEELAVGVDQRHQRHGHGQYMRDEACDAVEGFLRRQIQKPGFGERRETLGG